MPIWVNDNGTKRQIIQAYVNDNGVKRTIHTVWVNDNGTKRAIYLAIPDLPASLADFGVAATPSNASAGIVVQTDGDILAYSDSSDLGDWILPKSAASEFNADWSIRLTGTGDTPDAGGLSLNVWYDISVERDWHFVQSGVGSKSFTGTLAISKDGGTTTYDSCSVTIEAEVT